MKRLARLLALAGTFALASTIGAAPAFGLETEQARMEAADAAGQARIDMIEAFGEKIERRDSPEPFTGVHFSNE